MEYINKPPPGMKKRSPAELKEMVLRALDKVGGINYLAEQAKNNPAAFMSLVGKLLPKVVDQNNTHEVTGLAELLRSISSKENKIV